MKPFGYLLALDLYNVEEAKLDDVKLCWDYLIGLPLALKMERSADPIVLPGDREQYPVKGTGISAWVPLIESGIQFHSVSVKNFLSIDVYSCCEFDPQVPIQYTWDVYRGGEIVWKDIDNRLIMRGLRYHEF